MMTVVKQNTNNSVYQKRFGVKLCSTSIIRKLPGISALPKQLKNFQFFFPTFTELSFSSVKDCLICLQFKRVPSKISETTLQPVSSLDSYPSETLQTDLVGALKSPVHRYVLTAVDVFANYFFAVPWTNVRARALPSIFSDIVICQKQFSVT